MKKEQQTEVLKKDLFFAPGVDYVFKKVFGSEDKKEILKSLICGILKMPPEEIKDITIMNGELAKKNSRDKLSRLDILLKLNNQKNINLEMQMFNYKTLPRRILYYWSQLYVSTSMIGKEYDELTPCITIWILNETMFKDTEKAHTIFTIKEKELDIQLSDVFEAHIIELTKTDDNNSKLNEWIKFFRLKNKEEMKMLRETTTDAEIKEAIDIVTLMSLDEKSRYEYINRMMEIMDYNTLKKEAMQEGIEEEKIKIAKNLLDVLDIKTISLKTGLSIEQVERIAKGEQLSAEDSEDSGKCYSDRR